MYLCERRICICVCVCVYICAQQIKNNKSDIEWYLSRQKKTRETEVRVHPR
jgi:hypothetical protein